MKRTKLLVAGLITIILLLVVVQASASNRISTAGIELGKLQTEVKEVKRQNALLREKILNASSLTKIASAAGEKGFIEAKAPIYLSPMPLARN